MPARIWGISLPSHLDDRHVTARMAAPRAVLDAAGISAEIDERSDSTAAQAGAPHRPAERIGARVARQLLEEADSGATIDRHTSDQIIPFESLADGTTRQPGHSAV